MRVVTREHRFWLFLLYFQGRVTTRSGQPIKARRCPAESGAGCIMDSALVLCAAAGTPERQLAMNGGPLLNKRGTTRVSAVPCEIHEAGKRDPQMHSSKKGNQWYFGMKGAARHSGH